MSITSKTAKNAEKFRVVFLGDQGVGKTSIIEKYTTDHFDETHNSTVGIDFNVKDVTKDANLYRLQMWDTAGQQRYRSLIPTYLKNAHCVVFVYDITKSKSLENLTHWHNLFKENQEAPGVIVGNKADLVNGRKVNKAEAEEFSKKLNLKHIEVSAKTGKRVNELFDGVLESIIKAQEENFLEPNTTRENFNQKEKKESVRKEKIELERTKKSAGQKVRDKCCPEG